MLMKLSGRQWRILAMRTGWVALAFLAGATASSALIGPRHSDPQPTGAPIPTQAPAPARKALWADPAAEYVPLCEDTPEGAGPCVMLDDLDGVNVWWYVGPGAHYPDGRARVTPCRVEDGGPVPCVWVPSVMGEYPNAGDSGAYVYR